MSVINISDLDLYLLIQELWKHMTSASFFIQYGSPPYDDPSNEDIAKALIHDNYIYHLNGRCIKTNFSDLTKVNTRPYNRDGGDEAFENIVSKLRQ